MTTIEDLAVRDNVTVALTDCAPVRARVRVPWVDVCVSPVARAAVATIEHTGAGPPPWEM